MVESNKPANKDKTETYIASQWEDWYVKGLSDFIECPNLSPMFDSEFLTNGLIWDCAKLVDDYINKLNIAGMTKHTFNPEGKSPMIVYIIEA